MDRSYQASHDALDTVNRVKMPAILLINIRGYRHFVVVKGINSKQKAGFPRPFRLLACLFRLPL